METNRIDLAFALASKNAQTKSTGNGNNGAFADMLLGAMGQKSSTVSTDKAQVRPAETYTPRRRFDDYAPYQFDAHNNTDTHTDCRVENSQSRSRWSVDDTSTNPGHGPRAPGENTPPHGHVVHGSPEPDSQPGDVTDAGTDGTVDPATDIEAPEGDQDATIDGEDCSGQESGSDADGSDAALITATVPASLPEEAPATTDLEVDAVQASVAATTGATGTASTDNAPAEDPAAAALSATAALPEATAAANGPENMAAPADGDDADEATSGEAAKQGVTFSATLALTDTADDAAAAAESQVSAITARNERQIEDAGTSFRRNTANARRNQGNGTGATGGQTNAPHQASTGASAAAVEAHAGNSASETTPPLSGTIPVGFDTGLGNATGLPGWNLHLAQGAAIRRGDFVANLRQHLQNLPAHEQVALSIQRSLRDGGGSITLQLSPAELGRIHLKLKIDEENNVQASVTVERPATLELLQRDMKALERALQEAGLKAGPGDLSFSLQGGDPESFAREFGSGNGSGSNGTGQANGADGAEDTPAAIAAPVVDTADGWVDVQV
ncbi:MAG: flagellar hook-length control protein FliK [Proteobacteria bacterium]|nr:flagellar hook-length control protein FliK [Pseudomonadota bacterium]